MAPSLATTDTMVPSSSFHELNGSEKSLLTSVEPYRRRRGLERTSYSSTTQARLGDGLHTLDFFSHLPDLYAFCFSHVIGVFYAACIAETTPAPLTVFRLLVTLLRYSVLLRGIACTWNDNVDQDFDCRVVRTRHRPIARGAVSTWAAHLFTGLQMLVGLPMLAWLFPARCTTHALPVIALFLVYALMKRITYYPQVVLGVPFAWDVFFCVSVLDADPAGGRSAATLALVGANVLWTIVCDTIYAHQDIVDDERAGVKGMALRFRHTTKTLAYALTAGQIALLTLCGRWAGFGAWYYLGTVNGVALTMLYYIRKVDLKSPESCGAWFHRQFWLVGAGFVAGLVAEYCRLLATLSG